MTTKFAPLALVCAMLVVALAAGGSAGPSLADVANPIMARFADAETTASNTARIGLAPVILEMQAAAREMNAVATSDVEMKALIVHAMNLTIDYYLAFQSQATDAQMASLKAEAEGAWQAITDLANIRARDAQ